MNGESRINHSQAVLFSVWLLLTTPIFYLFTYNSGYGYDALEYYVIGRSLNDGFPFFAFTPSKSFALYYVVAWFLQLGFTGHAGISLIITVCYLLTTVTCFVCTKEMFNARAALVAGILTSLCAVSMEMNFLEPEVFVVSTALIGCVFISRAVNEDKAQDWIVGSFIIGLGLWFKTVSAFYLLAIFLSVFFWHGLPFVDRIRQSCRVLFFITVGCGLSQLPPLVHFFVKGQFEEYIHATFVFPLFYYPANTYWLSKLYTKLLWFDVLILIVVLICASQIKQCLKNRTYLLVLFLGFVPMLALFKTQATHYVFPGAAFLSIWVGISLNQYLENKHFDLTGMKSLAVTCAISVILIVSVILYKPGITNRLTAIKDYSTERSIKEKLQSIVPEGGLAIYFGNAFLYYWLTGHYPNIGIIGTDVQASYWIEHNAEKLMESLSDPDLRLVELNINDVGFVDPNFLNKESNRKIMQRANTYLADNFKIVDLGLEGRLFWVREKS